MSSHAYSFIGAFIVIPNKVIKTPIVIKCCTNASCENHIAKEEVEKKVKFCSNCGSAIGPVQKIVKSEMSSQTLEKDYINTALQPSYSGNLLYDPKFVDDTLNVHYVSGHRFVDFDKAQEVIQDFKKEYKSFLNDLRKKYGFEFEVRYGFLVQWG